MQDDELKRVVDGWLAQRPRTIESLAEDALKTGLVAADDLFEAEHIIDDLISATDETWVTGDDLVVLTSTYVDTGMTFTHRITQAELDDEAVVFAPDLTVLDWDAREGLELGSGGRVRVDYGDLSTPSVLRGPQGWLDAVAPGDLAAFSRVDGCLSVRTVEGVADGAAEIAALGEAAVRWIGGGQGEEEVPVLMEAMARDASLFRAPVPPVGELMEAAGLERRGVEWGWAAEEWRTHRERFTNHDQSIRRRHGLGRCCNASLDRVEAAWGRFIVGEDIDTRAVAADLGHSAVASAFAESHSSNPAAVVKFADLVTGTGGRHAAAAHALTGLAERWRDDVVAAERAFETAVALDPDLGVAAGELATLKLDRGDLARAHSLSLHDDVEPGMAEWIAGERARQSALRPKAGRNDPCPCGSGKKFKKCCAAGGPLSLGDRVPLVLQRMVHFATSPEHQFSLFGLAISAAGADDPDLPTAIRRFLDDPFLVDVAVHEGGLGEEYVDERAPLLPADEIELLQRVLAEPRRLWEILRVDEGVGVELRDTSTGEVIEVIERSGSQGRSSGELLLARTARVDDAPVLFGVPLVVPLRERGRVLEMLDGWLDADTLASWFGSLFRMPLLLNREGEDIVLRRTRLGVVDDPDVVVEALDTAYQRDAGAWVWHETTAIEGDEGVIRGVIRFDGDELTVESNSEERQERLLDTILDLIDADIIDDENGDDFDFGEAEDDGGPLDLSEMPDDVRAAVEKHLAGYEQRWVDESIPALGGLTPRQALDDPTRREDLFSLLREMRAMTPPEGGFAMSVDRLEDLLGIDQD
ncbi:MAG: SEC-C metal-binding domain-containing protein [Acidimicrobiales bacterium]|nr:SEC-C metal-binding domain-containing protein [Acidimicrobiales bacterium]